MKIVSVNVAQIGPLFEKSADNKASANKPAVMTAIYKQPIAGAAQVRRLGIVGDSQADRTVHGGIDKAVYAYPLEHYAFWRQEQLRWLRRDENLMPGALGENLTLSGAALLEQELWVGDRLAAGTVLLEITMPRKPCFKLAAKLGMPHAIKLMVQSGFSGFYLKVINEGTLQAGDALVLTPGPRVVSLNQINQQRRMGSQTDLF